MNELKAKIKAGKNILGTMVCLPSIAATEIMGYCDYDALWIDTEHSAAMPETCYAQLVAAKSVGKAAVVRVPQDDLTFTKKILEMGPDGIVFPMVHDKEEAEKLLSYTLYPPHGTRGCGPQRAVRYGMDDELQFFKEGADIVRLLQIECKSFVDDLEEVAANPFVDGFILGFADLSGSIGEIGDFFGENNMALARKAIEIATRHGKIVGTATLATDEKTLSMLYDMGIRMIFTGADFNYMIRGAKETYANLKKVLG